jgi:hypothetical protein
MRQKHIQFVISVAVFFIHPLIAQTPTWKPGDTFVYEQVSHVQISGGHLPPQAYAPPPSQNSSIKVTVTSLDSDGTALVHVAIDSPFPEKEIASRMPGGPLAAARNSVILTSARKAYEAQNRYMAFDARLTRDGVLLVAVDNTPQSDDSPKAKALTQADLAHMRDQMVTEGHSPEYHAQAAENQADGLFRLPNAVVLSCVKRTSLAPGDAWHVVSKPDGATYDVTVSGKQSYRGHDAIVLNAKYRMENPNGSTDADATIYYDLQAHLIIGAHSVTSNEIQVTGVKSTTTTDLNLKE